MAILLTCVAPLLQAIYARKTLTSKFATRLASSMKENGQLQPITVRIVDEMEVDGKITNSVPVLIFGAHRLAAAKFLGWTKIECVEREDDPVKAEMAEIAENLHRLDLTKEQRDQHIRRYAELLEKLQSGQSVQIESKRDDGSGHRPKGIATQIAEQTGLSARTVKRAMNPVQRVVIQETEPDSEEAYNRWAGQMNRLWFGATEEWQHRWESELDRN